MDYRITPPSKGFMSFELRRAAYSDDIEVVVLESSYLLTIPETLLWLSTAGFPNGPKVLDILHNCRRLDCILDPPGYRVNHDPIEPEMEAEEIELVMSAAVGTRIPFQPELVTSPFDRATGFRPTSQFLNHRSNQNAQ